MVIQNAPENVIRMRIHEAGHAIVTFVLGFEINRMHVSQKIQAGRIGGVDVVPLAEGTFDSEVPLETRREIAKRVIAFNAAGYLAERRQYNDNLPAFCSQDDVPNIITHSVYGVFTNEDVEFLESHEWTKDNGWSKWGEANKLVSEGEDLAKQILEKNWRAVISLVDEFKFKTSLTKQQIEDFMAREGVAKI